jgi:hypothetical protein
LILFLAWNLAMVIVMYLASETADLNRIYYGVDWQGKTCHTGDMEGLKNQYWPNPYYYQSLGAVCLDSCPGTNTSMTASGSLVGDGTLLCVCNNQLTVGQTGDTVIDTDNGAAYTKGYTAATTVSNSITNTNANYLGDLCGTTEAARKGYVSVEATAENIAYLYPYTPVGIAAAGTNSHYSTPGALYGKFNVPVCNYVYKTMEALYRCMPYLTTEEMTALFNPGSGAQGANSDFQQYFDSGSDLATALISDIGICWYVILACIGIAFFSGMMYLSTMKYCATCIVFTGLIGAILSITLVVGAFYYYWRELVKQTEVTPQLATYDNDVTNANIALAFLIFFGVVDLIVTCTVLCMCKQIQVACEVLKLAADGVMDMPILILYPVGEGIATILAVVVWCYGAAFIATAGDITQNSVYGYSEYTYSDNLQAYAVMWLFELFWVTEMIASTGFMVVAFCFCIWFFTPIPDGTKIKTPILKVV